MARVPIACTLGSDAASGRIEEWRALLVGDVLEAVRTSTSVRFRLRSNDEAVLRSIELSRREKACCAFFDFRLVVLSNSIWLEVEAPEDADSILDGLFALHTS
ncbi:MAG: hypothetical protein ACRDVC_09170 [Acidimicrobiales bacterium]